MSRATSAAQNSSANSMPKRPPPIMEPPIIEPMPPIMPPPPRVDTNSNTTIAPTRAPRSTLRLSLMAFLAPPFLVSELSIPREVFDFMSKIARLADQLSPIERALPIRRRGALSVRWAQPGQGDRDEPADRCLGRQATGCCEGVEAVARKLLGRDVIPDVARICGLPQQVSDDLPEVLLRSVSVLTSMQERREFAGVALVLDECVGLEHGFEPLTRVARLVPDFGEMFEVAADVTFVPGEQDSFDVREILVERRTPDAGFLGNPRHRHRQQPVLGHQRPSGVQDRVAHHRAVRLYGLVPQSWHRSSIHDGDTETICLTSRHDVS